MPTNDPALGLSGALTTMQGQPPMTAAANMSAGGAGGSGSAELSRAARSLESVQGNVSGQTMAIQQMTMSGQQSAANLNMLLNQLSTQVSGLNQAVMQMAGAARMGTMPAPMSQPMSMGLPGPSAPPMQMSGGSQFGAQAGSMARGGMSMAGQGMGMAGRGLSAAGGFFGGVGAAAASPFFGAQVHGAAPGGFGPRLGSEAGFMRSAGMAAGVGIRPEMLKQANASQIQALGSERMQHRFQDSVLGAAGGAAHLGLALGGEAMGAGAMSAMGIGGLGGFAGGMVAGGGIAAVGGMAVSEVMNQTANIRGHGEQFGRNAWRFMDSGAVGGNKGLRKPGMSQRSEFGRGMNQMSIQDLTFNDNDVTDMFAGMSEQDMMRGMRSTQEVVQRMRKAKETFKLIGQTMGQGIQEAGQTMGILQSLGMDPTGARGRATIFGASSIPGMTGAEVVQKQGQYGQQFTGTGAGVEAAGVMEASLRSGQMAINRGTLNTREIAAMGGREGVQGSMANLQARFLESSMGKASQLAGAGGIGKGIHSTIGMAGSRAMNANRVVEMQAGDLQKEYLESPYAARMDMYAKLKSQANVFKQGTNLSDRNAMVSALRQLDPNITGIQADVIIKQFEALPQEMQQKQRDMVGAAAEQAHTQAVEQFSPVARAKRAAKQMLSPAAEGLNKDLNKAGATLARWGENIEMAVSGREVVNLGGELTTESLKGLRGRGRERMEMEQMEVVPEAVGRNASAATAAKARNAAKAKRNEVRKNQNLINDATPSTSTKAKYKKMALGRGNANQKKIEALKEKLKDPSSASQERRAAMKEALSLISGGAYEGFDADSKGGAMMKRAIQDAAMSVLGIDPVAALTGNETAGGLSFSEGEKDELNDMRDELGSILGETRTGAAEYEAPELQAVISALSSGSLDPATEKAARDADFGGQVDKLKELHAGKDDWFTAHFMQEGESQWESLQKFAGGKQGKRMGKLSGMEGAANRLQLSGQAAKGLLGGLGRTIGGLEGLGGKNVDDNLAALGRLPSVLTSKEIDKIGSKEGGKRMAHVMRELKKVDLSDGLSPGETSIISKLAPGMSESDIAGLKDREDLGMVAAMAMSPKGQMGVTSTGPNGFTADQAANMTTMKDQLVTITNLLNQMKDHSAFNP